MSPGGRASAFVIRETLDEAVRRLAVSQALMADRLARAGEALTSGLQTSDFPDKEDRELFNQIQKALADASCPNDADGSSAATDPMSDATAEEIASDILDLRDTTMGRAIRNARVTTHAEARGRSRR